MYHSVGEGAVAVEVSVKCVVRGRGGGGEDVKSLYTLTKRGYEGRTISQSLLLPVDRQ
jgi:hypothetical protein